MKVEAVVKTLEYKDGADIDLERVLALERIWQKHNLKNPDGKTDKS